MQNHRKVNKIKMNILKNTTELAKLFCGQYIGKNSVAVDATCGKGNDTLWLAERCSRVYAFDIQKEATDITSAVLAEAGFGNVKVINDSHENMAEYIKETVNLFMFNLGYLPGGDKNITTDSEATLHALECSLRLLETDGLICVIMYWGHPQGAAERKEVLEWASHLDKGQYHCVHTDMVNQPNCPPEILLVTRKK